MRKFEMTGTAVAASLTGFASNATGATFTLAANDAGDSLAHKVTVKNDSATDHSGKTIALVGTDAAGNAQTETLTGPTGTATVTSSKYFKTLTSATPSATIGGDTFDIGWAVDAICDSAKMQYSTKPFLVGFGCVISGTPTFSVQHSFDNGVTWFTPTATSAKTANLESTYTYPVHSIRLLWTAAGGVTLTGYQD